MKITKVINNNVVSSIDEAGNEVILMGTGLRFKGKEGKVIDDSKIQIFDLEDAGVSAEYDTKVRNTVQITTFIEYVIDKVKDYLVWYRKS